MSVFAEIEAFFTREWPGSRLDDGYGLVVIHAPVTRRFEPAQPEYPESAARRALAAAGFRDTDELWLVTVGLDPAGFTGRTARVERRDAWTTPDAGVHNRHEQYAAAVARADCDLDAMLVNAIRAPHYLLLLDPARKLGVEPGWMARPVFVYASTPAPIDAVQKSSLRGTWDG